MTGKERKQFIVAMTNAHAKERAAYTKAKDAGHDTTQSVLWGVMLGIETAARVAGFQVMSQDMAFLREEL